MDLQNAALLAKSRRALLCTLLTDICRRSSCALAAGTLHPATGLRERRKNSSKKQLDTLRIPARFMLTKKSNRSPTPWMFPSSRVGSVRRKLGAEGYVFWGGREGYSSLWNTDMKREVEHLAKFLHMAVDYKKQIGFKGAFYIEPKPKEPTKHQYDFDAATCLNFLREYGLLEHFKLNLETNHATLAGHTMQHECEVAAAAGALGTLDANTGDELIGWDTDQFPTSLYLTTQVMLTVLKMGGFTTGGLNFDAKVRRESFEPIDLFYAHIGGMDAFARGLKIAAAIRGDGRLAELVKNRYASWDSGIGAAIEAGKEDFTSLEKYAMSQPDPVQYTSGRQEFCENIINAFI